MALYFVQPLLPSIAQNFDVSPAAAAATLSVPAIAMALTFIVVGPISDRWGRQLIMRVSLVTTGVLAVAVALAPTWPLLLLARGLEGVALAGLPAVALAYLREEIHVESPPPGQQHLHHGHRGRRRRRSPAARPAGTASRLARSRCGHRPACPGGLGDHVVPAAPLGQLRAARRSAEHPWSTTPGVPWPIPP